MLRKFVINHTTIVKNTSISDRSYERKILSKHIKLCIKKILHNGYHLTVYYSDERKGYHLLI